ncbi:hypothetical protein Cgig2_002148 [Carnegiea gigantea]|uniref:Uncharacterized protein n=1 Tax=Carnegiea gigantea TaxID=171969 RepID=A0A9Q1QPJ1_9CARY|nr:hypothetical protein Cgig2_002148 [Carnegiea gigantea]
MDESSVHLHSTVSQQVICEDREREPLKLEMLATRLYEAALVGDVSSLLEVLRLDASIPDRCVSSKQTRTSGRARSQTRVYTTSLVRSKGALGDLECFTCSESQCLERNEIGRNPVHVAALKGQKLVLGKLLEVKPQAACERTSIGETVLHLCVKHNQRETLKFLVEFIGNAPLLNAKDSIGDTILHLAVATRQVETLKFLLGDERIEKNVINANGYTTMDLCRKVRGKNSIDQEIQDCLEGAKALPGKAAKKLQERDHT